MSALILALFLNHDWRALQMAYSVPAAAFLAYWWWAPESIRWLISQVCSGLNQAEIFPVHVCSSLQIKG